MPPTSQPCYSSHTTWKLSLLFEKNLQRPVAGTVWKRTIRSVSATRFAGFISNHRATEDTEKIKQNNGPMFHRQNRTESLVRLVFSAVLGVLCGSVVSP